MEYTYITYQYDLCAPIYARRLGIRPAQAEAARCLVIFIIVIGSNSFLMMSIDFESISLMFIDLQSFLLLPVSANVALNQSLVHEPRDAFKHVLFFDLTSVYKNIIKVWCALGGPNGADALGRCGPVWDGTNASGVGGVLRGI